MHARHVATTRRRTRFTSKRGALAAAHERFPVTPTRLVDAGSGWMHFAHPSKLGPADICCAWEPSREPIWLGRRSVTLPAHQRRPQRARCSNATAASLGDDPFRQAKRRYSGEPRPIPLLGNGSAPIPSDTRLNRLRRLVLRRLPTIPQHSSAVPFTPRPTPGRSNTGAMSLLSQPPARCDPRR